MSLNFEKFCDHAADGQLALVQCMLESGGLRVNVKVHDALCGPLRTAASKLSIV
jgi:hypothetical protein